MPCSVGAYYDEHAQFRYAHTHRLNVKVREGEKDEGEMGEREEKER